MRLRRTLHALYWTCLMFMVLGLAYTLVTNELPWIFCISLVAFLVNGQIMTKLNAWILHD